MVDVILIKKTQKKWSCNCDVCLNIINANEMMVRESYNKWHQEVYCLECGKDIIEDKIKELKGILVELNKPEYYIDFITKNYEELIKKMEQWVMLINTQNINKK